MFPKRSIWAAPRKPDVDQPALQVEGEQLEHRHHGGRPGDDRGIADRERQAGRPRAEHPRLVDQLHVGGDGPLGEVDGDVRQPDADEADVLAGQLAGGRHDHHLGLREGGRGPAQPALIGTPRSRRSPDGADPGAERRDPLRAQLLDVGRAAVEVVDPVAEPRLERLLVPADRVPVEVEAVVAVVGALDVRGMGAERLHDHRVHDQPGDDGPVRVGPDRRPRRPAPRPRRSPGRPRRPPPSGSRAGPRSGCCRQRRRAGRGRS